MKPKLHLEDVEPIIGWVVIDTLSSCIVGTGLTRREAIDPFSRFWKEEQRAGLLRCVKADITPVL